MPRDYRDLVVDTPDGVPRYRLVDSSGKTVLDGVKVEVSSAIIQNGDSFGALGANRVLRLDDDNTPLLDIKGGTYNNKPGTIRLCLQDNASSEAPTSILPAELVMANNGRLYSGQSTGKPMCIPNMDDLSTAKNELQASLNSHANNKSNPHVVTAGQVGAPTTQQFNNHANSTSNPHKVTPSQVGSPTTTAFNNHANSKSNPHQVTASQAGALPAGGGTLTGNMTISKNTPTIYLRNSANQTASIIWGNNGESFVIAMGGNNSSLRVTNGDQSQMRSVIASDFVTSSSKKYKTRIRNVSQSYIDSVKKLNVVNYSLKGAEGDTVGVIAEEVAEIQPEFVHFEKGGAEAVKLSPILFSTLGYVQELEKAVEGLKEEVKALKKRK